MQLAFPTPDDNDAEDVAWGLTTGAALWRQGERYDAIVWLKRAVEAANEAGASGRAEELNRAATDLMARLAGPPQEAPASAPKTAVAPALAPPSTPKAPAAPPLAPGSTPRTAAAPPVPRAAAPKPPPAPRAPTPPPFRGAPPAPPKAPPPPPPRSKTPLGMAAVADPFAEPPPARAPMPSVTTSAPTLEALTVHPSPTSTGDGTDARQAPPPPTILPEIPSGIPTPQVALSEPDEVTPILYNMADALKDVDPDEPPPFSPRAEPFDLGAHNVIPPGIDAPESGDVAVAADEDGARDEDSEAEASAPEEHAPQETESSEPARELPPGLVAALDALPLTAAQKKVLAETATLESLSSEEDVSVNCLALVVEGRASAQATVADITAVSLKAGELLYARSSIAETLSLRLVAESDATVVAHWDHSAEAVLAETPDLVVELKHASDRAQAIAGCSMGPVGERLDDNLRMRTLEKLAVRVLAPNEVIAPAGQPVPGMVIIGVGAIDLEGANGSAHRLGPGDFLFATEVLGGGAAPTTARAGAKGAIVLFGARAMTHELLMSCPPLLEVFAGM